MLKLAAQKIERAFGKRRHPSRRTAHPVARQVGRTAARLTLGSGPALAGGLAAAIAVIGLSLAVRETAIQFGVPVTGGGGLASLAVALPAAFAVIAVHRNLPPGHGGFGAANCVTLARLSIALALATVPMIARPADGEPWPIAFGWVIFAAAATAAILDLLDGWLARRLGAASPVGARFDLEVDAFAILIFSALLHASGTAGVWVFAVGALRYVFSAMGYLIPQLARPLRPSGRRRVVCGFAYVAFVGALAPIGASDDRALLVSFAAAALGLSFAVDVTTLCRTAPGRGRG